MLALLVKFRIKPAHVHDFALAIRVHVVSAHFLQPGRASVDWVEKKSVSRCERSAP